MSHYVSDDVARQKDKKALEMIKALNPEGLYEIVVREISCAVICATVMLLPLRRLSYRGKASNIPPPARSAETMSRWWDMPDDS